MPFSYLSLFYLFIPLLLLATASWADVTHYRHLFQHNRATLVAALSLYLMPMASAHILVFFTIDPARVLPQAAALGSSLFFWAVFYPQLLALKARLTALLQRGASLFLLALLVGFRRFGFKVGRLNTVWQTRGRPRLVTLAGQAAAYLRALRHTAPVASRSR